MSRWTVALAMSAVLACAAPAGAQLLGPSPYLSFADSPFNGVSFSYFHLENFEDGALNTPGLTASAGVIGNPGALTDSVDGDDAAGIDGSGTAGHSLYVGTTNAVTFTFNTGVLDSLPTHAGVVWTDVGGVTAGTPGVSNVLFEAFDAANVSLGSIGPFFLGDGSASGGTAEDRFFGITHAGGISKITITLPDSRDWEVDHIQYGAAVVPGPDATAVFLGTATFGAALIRRRRLPRQI